MSLAVAATLSLLGSLSALAQEATPATSGALTSAGLPELHVSATTEGMTVDQTEVPAGRYLVHFTNTSDNPEASAGFVRLVKGASLEDLSWADELAAGTPLPLDMAPQPDGLEWLYETYITGAGSVFSPEVIVDLPAGEYGVWADDPVSLLAAAPLTVTGDPDATISGSEPEASVTIVEEGAGGEGFHFTVQGDLSAGPQVVKVLNASDQPHFILGLQYPEPITEEQLLATLTFDPTTGATPTPDMLDFSQLSTVAWASAQSAGTTQWVTMDLEAGQVILLCFVTDPVAGNVPHAFQGMAQVVDVAD
jgi:hypothetical protein